MFVVFFISALAETNRPPFDFPEAESELVAGYQTDYSGMPFVLFLFGEYINILLMCAMTTILFLGGWLPPVDVYPLNAIPGFIWFILKVTIVFYMFAMQCMSTVAIVRSELKSWSWAVGQAVGLTLLAYVLAWLTHVALS